MYNVTVFHKSEAVDERQFKFGTFAEIGFYLDHYGYNDPDYKVVITFA